MTGKGDGWAWALRRGALVALVALSGCGGARGPAEGGAVASAAGGAVAGGDALAPEVFDVSEPGLWDGRPSLGGVWVAHPGARDPERVRILNTETGAEVSGALFRRERDLPGPALQVSSDAAAALGMLAGDPTTLQVTALRRQDTAAPEAAPAPDAAPADGPADGPIELPPELSADASAAPPPAPVDPAPVDPAAIEAVARATAAILAAAPPEPPPAPAPAAAAAIATTPLDASAGPAGPAATYVQVGRFTVQANADETARAVAAQGLPAGVVDEDGAWLVWVGPAADDAQAQALLRAAVEAGFADAYLVQG